MKKATLLFVTMLIVSGCASYEYRNLNPARNNQNAFQQDMSYCRAVAAGSAPMPNMQPYQNNVYGYSPRSGTVRDQYGNTYNYQEKYNPMAAAQGNMAMAQQSFNNAAISLQNYNAERQAQNARDAIMNQCMAQLGWESRVKQ